MDIDKIRKYIIPKIEAGKVVDTVREAVESVEQERRVESEGLERKYAPLLKKQDEVRDRIDERQDQMIKAITENQGELIDLAKALPALTHKPQPAIGDLIDIGPLPGPSGAEEKSKIIELDVDGKFDDNDRIVYNTLKLASPHDLTSLSSSELSDERSKAALLGKSLGTKKSNAKTKQAKAMFDRQIEALRKYREVIDDWQKQFEFYKTGSGLKYNQPKRNAYKVDLRTGKYGNLKIDLPKLIGRLELVAYKDGKKVYDREVDFDTLDLFTKRFNSKKRYSSLSKDVFRDINELSEIPIHRTSMKFSKIGGGAVYYNDVRDLISRLELLGGSIEAGNDGIKDEFSVVAHTLNKLGTITNKQLSGLIQGYVI